MGESLHIPFVSFLFNSFALILIFPSSIIDSSGIPSFSNVWNWEIPGRQEGSKISETRNFGVITPNFQKCLSLPCRQLHGAWWRACSRFRPPPSLKALKGVAPDGVQGERCFLTIFFIDKSCFFWSVLWKCDHGSCPNFHFFKYLEIFTPSKFLPKFIILFLLSGIAGEKSYCYLGLFWFIYCTVYIFPTCQVCMKFCMLGGWWLQLAY